jgi:uncharacterized protein (DUF1697 family)
VSARWIALLRGVNVGGGNRLSMAALRATLGELGLERVGTYIQSGNVVFDAAEPDAAHLAALIRTALIERHELDAPVVLRAAADFARIATRHPDADGGIAPKFLHVCFLDRVPDPATRAALDPSAFEPDGWTLDGSEVYLRYPNGSGRSKLTLDVLERAYGVTATSRNLNTVRKLVELAG